MSDEKKPSYIERFKSLTPRQKQYIVLIAVGSVFAALVLGSVTLWNNNPPMLPQTVNNDVKAKDIAVPGQQVDPKDVWMAQSSSRLQAMDDMLRSMQQKIEAAEREKNEERDRPAQSQPAASILPPLPPLNPPQPEQAAQPMQTAAVQPPALPPLPASETEKPKEPSIASFEVSKPTAEPESSDKAEQAKTYVPSGSFARVALLGGFDAPAGGQAQNNPIPVLLRVQNNAFLPNRYRARVKECHIIGSGYGDLSSERAYIRTETLSCVLKSGEVVDTSLKGYIVGEDGKAGMRGRLVSKQGQVLANALATGVISGFGQGLQQAATTYSTSPLGSVATVDSNKRIQSGIGIGVGQALDRLSRYYITLAEKMFPVIEIDAMRQVDVVFTKGVSLGLGDSSSEGEYTDVWKKGRQLQNKSVNPQEDYKQ